MLKRKQWREKKDHKLPLWGVHGSLLRVFTEALFLSFPICTSPLSVASFCAFLFFPFSNLLQGPLLSQRWQTRWRPMSKLSQQPSVDSWVRIPLGPEVPADTPPADMRAPAALSKQTPSSQQLHTSEHEVVVESNEVEGEDWVEVTMKDFANAGIAQAADMSVAKEAEAEASHEDARGQRRTHDEELRGPLGGSAQFHADKHTAEAAPATTDAQVPEESFTDWRFPCEHDDDVSAEGPFVRKADEAETVLVDAVAPAPNDPPPVPRERSEVDRRCCCLGGPYGFHRPDCDFCGCMGAEIGVHSPDCRRASNSVHQAARNTPCGCVGAEIGIHRSNCPLR